VDSNKGILAKFLEKVIRVLLIKECKNIGNLKINLIATTIQIIKGEIQKINITAKDIDYKYLLLDEVEIEANQLKINFNLSNKELKFKGNPIIKFKIKFSETSLKEILLSNNWNWIGNMISSKILKHERLKDLRIINNNLLLEAFESNAFEQINVKAENGKIYLFNKNYNEIIKIPIEDKIYIKNVKIENNLINIFAKSSIIL
tara:strand:- start:219 stop:827 length:609 start_codon:yes stop_codon:yes gene_type:complete